MNIVHENTRIFIVSPFPVRAALHLEYIFFCIVQGKDQVSCFCCMPIQLIQYND